MPIYYKGKQLSPCICSKAKYALGLKSNKPKHMTTCSQEYWDLVIDILGKGLPKDRIIKAKARTDLFLRKKKRKNKNG